MCTHFTWLCFSSFLNLFKLRCSKQKGKVAINYCTFLNRQLDTVSVMKKCLVTMYQLKKMDIRF